MEWAISLVMDKLGLPGVIIGAVIIVAQNFKKSELEATIEFGRSLLELFTNIPRRFISEWSRVSESVDTLKAAGLEDAAALKNAKAALQGLVRVIAGTVEDAGNVIINFVFAATPMLVTIVKPFLRLRK